MIHYATFDISYFNCLSNTFTLLLFGLANGHANSFSGISAALQYIGQGLKSTTPVKYHWSKSWWLHQNNLAYLNIDICILFNASLCFFQLVEYVRKII